MGAFDTADAVARLRAAGGGYEIVHRSPGLELGVYVLEGSGTLEVEGERVELREGQAVFVPAGADHRFVGYEQLALLVVFDRPR